MSRWLMGSRKNVMMAAQLINRMGVMLFAAGAAVLFASSTSQAWAQADLGLVGVRSVHNRYLQAHTDGEMHASNEHRNEEETWHLIEVDKEHHVYALLNWRNHMFMSKKGSGCVPADRPTLSSSEQWILVSGKQYGISNVVAFKSVVDGKFMGTNIPGQDDACGGEVAARNSDNPPQNDGGWPGWWVVEAADVPEPGRDFWNTSGRTFEGIVTKLTPADVAALAGLLAL